MHNERKIAVRIGWNQIVLLSFKEADQLSQLLDGKVSYDDKYTSDGKVYVVNGDWVDVRMDVVDANTRVMDADEWEQYLTNQKAAEEKSSEQ